MSISAQSFATCWVPTAHPLWFPASDFSGSKATVPRAAASKKLFCMASNIGAKKQFKVNPLVGLLGYLNLWPVTHIVLNAGAKSEPRPSSSGSGGAEVAENLRKSILKLYGQFLASDGGAVRYDGLAASPDFAEYVRLADRLDEVDPAGLPAAGGERAAFFINVYNALLMHAVITLGPPADLLSRLRMYACVSYSIGGQVLSLNDMENGILRCNRASATFFARRPFGRGDARLGLALAEPPDGRIHFALNCGARGCPPIRFYTAAGLERQLDTAATGFCRAGVAVDEPARKVTLSRIFEWYAPDFVPPSPAAVAAAATAAAAAAAAGGSAAGEGGGAAALEPAAAAAGAAAGAGGSDYPVLRWVQPYLDAEAAAALGRLLDDAAARPEPIRVEYSDYDWGLNQA